MFGDLYGEQGSGSRGIFLSTDSGQTWQEASELSRDRALSGAQVTRLAIEEAKPNNLLAATLNLGVFASDLSGQKWFNLLPGVVAYDAFINPQNSEEIFVAGSRNRTATILKSSDRGTSWVQIYNEPSPKAAVTSLIFDPKTPTFFYAGLSSGTILRSVDRGSTWNALIDFKDRIVRLATTPDGTTIYALLRTQGLRRSTDGGKSWVELKLPDSQNQYNALVTLPGNATTLFVGTDHGFFASQNSGVTWTKLLLPVTPEVNNVSAIAINPQNNKQIFAAIRSTVYRSDDGGATWSVQALPTRRIISDLAIDPKEPNRVYAGLK